MNHNWSNLNDCENYCISKSYVDCNHYHIDVTWFFVVNIASKRRAREKKNKLLGSVRVKRHLILKDKIGSSSASCSLYSSIKWLRSQLCHTQKEDHPFMSFSFFWVKTTPSGLNQSPGQFLFCKFPRWRTTDLVLG